MTPATLQAAGEQFPLDNTMGSMLIGVVVSAILWGVSGLQTLYYFSRYPKDEWYLKSLVAIVTFLDTIHMIFITHSIYHYLITSYYDPTALNKVVWSVIVEAIPTGVTGALVQLFYTVRVWRLSKKNWTLTGTLVVLIVGNAIAGTAWCVLGLLKGTYHGLLDITPLTMTINALSVAADVIISVSLCIMLQRSKTGFRRSDTIITKLTIFFINTGLLTSMCAIGALISLAASPTTLLYASWYFCIGRLYVNSLLAALNARKTFRGEVEELDHRMVSFPTSAASPPATSLNTRNQNISILVETTQDYEAGKTGSESSIVKPSASDPYSRNV